MNHAKHSTLWSCASLISALAMLLVVGCQSAKEQSSSKPATATAAAPAAAPAMTAESTSALKAIRIDAGSTNSYTDSAGNVWLPDQGFADGDVIDRGED